MSQIKGRKIQTRISPDFLDTVGKSFKFKHGKGISEWLKNSLDHYLRLLEQKEETLGGSWPVFINLIDGAGQSKGPNLAVIDFGGTTYKYVEEFFLHWGDKSAASHGRTVVNAALTGGHGNGGKFYMREMWRDGARFLTWRAGKVTSLVVKKMEDKSTGVFELEDIQMGWRKSLDFALSKNEWLGGSESVFQDLQVRHPQIVSELEQSARGLSVIVGRRAVQVHSSNDVVSGGKWKYQQLIDDIRDAQQSRRPIRELSISVFVNGQLQIEKLTPRSIEPDPDWQAEDHSLSLSAISGNSTKQGDEVAGSLTIFKSVTQLTGRLKDLNSVFVTDDNGNPIAFYPIPEIPLPGYSPLLSFIQADLRLNFEGLSELVTNDRERLVDSHTTKSILEWVADKIWKRIQSIEKAYQEKKQQQDLKVASKLNESLNKHAHKFLQQIQIEILVDYVPDNMGGGVGGEGDGVGGKTQGSGGTGERRSGKGGTSGDGGDKEINGNKKKVRRPEFPRILLSGYDPDPSKENQDTKHLTDRHPPLHQDDVDRLHNVWWLNTSHPYADKVLKKGGPEGHAFKSHHLSMFRDMVQREALRILQRREAELPLDRIENELDEVSNKFLAELPWEIVQNLLE